MKKKAASASGIAENRAAAMPGASSRECNPASRAEMIAQAAYFRAERRGFAPGGEVSDWLEAEAEIAALPQVAA